MEHDIQNIVKIVTGIFEITNVLTAILFAVYCFVIVSSNPFIDKIRNTKSFIRSRAYIKNTVSIGIIIILLSKGIDFVPESITYIHTGIFILLVPMTAWWLIRFIGCMKRFDIMSST